MSHNDLSYFAGLTTSQDHGMDPGTESAVAPAASSGHSVPQNGSDAERMEFEAVATGLERAPRLSKLFRHLGEKYFSGQIDELTEFNIATEVLGRSKVSFATSDDAIARVEAHRLRKWLKTYYESKGRDHSIQIVLPPGTYVPAFSRHQGSAIRAAESTEAIPEALAPVKSITATCDPAAELPPDHPRESGKRADRPQPLWRRPVILLVTVLLVLALGIGIGVIAHFGRPSRLVVSSSQTANPGLQSTRPPVPAGATVAVPFRMILGYHDSPEPDSAGNLWLPDQYSIGGWSEPKSSPYIAGTSDSFLFRYGRAGDFSYKIPLRPGTYELHLYFVSMSATQRPEEDQDKSVFNLSINGNDALREFDPLSDAMGMNIADERVFRDVSPAQDGFLHIQLRTYIGMPSLRALEIQPGLPHKQNPIRITMRSTPWTDHNGQFWHPDTYYLGGRRLAHDQPVDSAVDSDLYSTERYGHFSYAIPVDPRDRYTVILHFTELFFGTPSSKTAGPDNRVFRVLCNGSTLLDDFDISRETSAGRPLVKTFYHIKPTAQGKLNILFEPIKNYATVSAIEVLDESN
jgi:hypothetical protein